MFDHAPVHDRIVIDDPDAPEPSRASPADEEMTMQVYVIGVWHRRTPDLKTTACGIPFHSQFATARRELLKGDLCPTCFTSFELAKAAEANRKEIP